MRDLPPFRTWPKIVGHWLFWHGFLAVGHTLLTWRDLRDWQRRRRTRR